MNRKLLPIGIQTFRQIREFGEYRYRLRYPNREVYQSLNNSLLRAWTPDGQEILAHKTRLGAWSG